MIQATYFLEVLSSWCFWAEPRWAELQRRYAGRVQFAWKIALMRPEDFPSSREQCDWFYRRSGTLVRSPFMLHSGWWEAARQGDYRAPNWVAEAGKDLGFPGDELRLALMHAALREGRKVGDLHESVAVARENFGLDADTLLAAARSLAVQDRVTASTDEFFRHQVNQRPTFVLTSGIGDKAVFSGFHGVEPLAAALEAMLADEAAYAAHEAHFGRVPA